jgi:hypothetical protein
MTPGRVDVWIWVLVYAGLLLLGLGLSVQSAAAPLGWSIVALGIALAIGGGVLVWVRSRMKD